VLKKIKALHIHDIFGLSCYASCHKKSPEQAKVVTLAKHKAVFSVLNFNQTLKDLNLANIMLGLHLSWLI
jgi:hypothetical protein